MKLLACSLFLLFSLLSAGAGGAAGMQDQPGAAAEGAIEAHLLALERQRAEAILRRDIPALRGLMDRYYQHVESRGRVRSKTELLRALARGDIRFRTYANETTDIQVLDGGAVAVAAGVFHSQEADPDAGLFRGRYVRIWVRQPDGWKNTFHQTTEIRPVTNK